MVRTSSHCRSGAVERGTLGTVAAVAAAGLRDGTPEPTATGYQLYTRLGSTPITRAEFLQELSGCEAATTISGRADTGRPPCWHGQESLRR